MYQSQRISPLSQFGILLGLLGGCLILAAFVVAAIVHWTTGASFYQINSVLADPRNVQVFRVAQGVSAFVLFCLPALILGIIVNKNPFDYLGFSNRFNARQMFIVLLLFLASFFVVGALSELNQVIPISKNLQAYFKDLDDQYTKQVLALAHMTTATDYIFSLIVLALLPAMFEEIFFRGALQKVMINLTRNALIGILITSIVFSAIHLSYYAFLPRLFLGLLLGYIFYYGKNTWLNITLHFLNNAFVITQMYVLSKAGKLNTDVMNETFPLYYGVLGIIAIFALFVVYKKECERYFTAQALKDEQNVFNIH